MKSKILYILLAVSLASCVVPRNYSRAKEKVDRIVAAFPEILENDTTIVTIDTTIITTGAELDTVVVLKKNDTIYIDREKIKIRVIRGKRDSIFLEAECIPDTIRLVHKELVPVYSIEEKNLIKKEFLNVPYWAWALIGLGLIFFIILILRRRRPRE